MDALERARRDVAEGRAWKARDRLRGLLVYRPDAAVADELAGIHHAMNDLPAAGALWFVTDHQSDAAQEAVAAWREQHGDAMAQWRTIPGPLREAFGSAPHIAALRAEARKADRVRDQRYQRKQRGLSPEGPVGMELLREILIATFLIGVGLSLIALLVIGIVTVWGWIAS